MTIIRSRNDEIIYAKENNIPMPQNDDESIRDIGQNLDALCLPRILDVKMIGVVTHVSQLFEFFFKYNTIQFSIK